MERIVCCCLTQRRAYSSFAHNILSFRSTSLNINYGKQQRRHVENTHPFGGEGVGYVSTCRRRVSATSSTRLLMRA
jgi:hypothetical protein